MMPNGLMLPFGQDQVDISDDHVHPTYGIRVSRASGRGLDKGWTLLGCSVEAGVGAILPRGRI